MPSYTLTHLLYNISKQIYLIIFTIWCKHCIYNKTKFITKTYTLIHTLYIFLNKNYLRKTYTLIQTLYIYLNKNLFNKT